MHENQLSRWGAISKVLQDVPPSAKVFLVGDTNDAWFGDFQYEFPPDHNGVVRVYSSVNAAMDACVAGRGDVILCMPNHAETISAATSMVIDVAGVSVIGLGSGGNRPVFTYSATAGTIELDADNTRLSNVILRSSISAVVKGINVDAENVRIDNIRMDWEETGDDFVTMIDIDAVNGTVIENCQLIAEDAAGCSEAIRLDDCDHVVIRKNHIYGDFTDSAIVGEGAAGANLLIEGNTIYNSDTTAGYVIDLNVTFTGIISKNDCGTLFATAPETAFDPGSCLCIENYVCNAVDESGALVPTTVST